MKLVIGSTQYDLEHAMQKASLNDLYDMTFQTGVGMSSLGSSLEGVNTDDLDAVMDDPKVFQALRCLIFLARRYAGEKVSVAQANAFPFSDLSFLEDETDEETDVDADPTRA